MRPTLVVKLSAEHAAQRANRFVRFPYRRSPPWRLAQDDDSLFQITRSSWRHRKDRISTSKHPEYSSKEIASWKEISCQKLPFTAITNGQDEAMVPVLQHGMEIALRGDGLYPLEAPWTISASRRSRKMKQQNLRTLHKTTKQGLYYDDSLRKIVQPENIAWHNIPGYIPAAKDNTLHHIAANVKGARYSSSTSSIIPALVSLYHLLSNFRDTDLLGGLSNQLHEFPIDFSKVHRLPVAFMVSRNNTDSEVYSVNAHSGISTGPSILRDLGHSMERMLTTCPNEFERKFVLSQQNREVDILEQKESLPHSDEEQFYHYSQVSKFVLRAQIDCRNEKTGEFFDIKTRAVAPIRYDLPNYVAFTSHRLKYLKGRSDSYEREFYDMVRSVFLKYALQLRIGRMSGALVAYHNTTEVLGVEFISLSEIQSYVFGNDHWADIAFGTAVQLLERILEDVTTKMFSTDPNGKVKIVLLTEWSKLKMYVYAQKIYDDEDEDDPFGPHEFSQRAKAFASENIETICKKLSGHGQWHYDSNFHEGINGVSVIGGHKAIQVIGGEKVDSGNLKQRIRPNVNNEILDPSKYDLGQLNSDNFKIWELDVVPLLNGERTPRNTFQFNEKDNFVLKYNLSEIRDVKPDLVGKFVTSLGRIYVR